MSSYPRRSGRGSARDASASAVVDLSLESDGDGSDGDGDVSAQSAPRFAKTDDGGFQTLSVPLIASVCGDSLSARDIRVQLKWGFPVKEESGSKPKHTFHRNEKIFAWDRGVLYEARVLRRKEGEEGVRYNVHYLGYKSGHDRWLAPIDMIKDNASSREYYCNFRGERANEGDESIQKETSTGTADFRPEPVQSGSNKTSGSTPSDEDDYEELRSRYLLPRIREKAELAGGITLRRQTKARMIDQKTKGFRMLRRNIDALLRRNDHAEVYRLLCQLRDYELDPRRVPAAVQLRGDDDVAEVLDLTNEDDDDGRCIIDVDHWITDVLLASAKRCDDRKMSPMETPSNPLPEVAQSNAAIRRYSSDSRSRVTGTSNQSLQAFSDDEDWGEDGSTGSVASSPREPIPTGQSPHLSPDAMEELESFVFEVIHNVCQDADADNESSDNSDSRRASESKATASCNPHSLTQSPPEKAVPRSAATSSGYDWSGVSWNDIPKPPGQLTIGDCRQFYVQSTQTGAPSSRRSKQNRDETGKTEQTVKCTASQQGGSQSYAKWDDIPKPPGQLTIGECRNFYVRSSTRTQSQRQSACVIPPSSQLGTAYGPSLQYHGLQGAPAHPTAVEYNAFGVHANVNYSPLLNGGQQYNIFAALLSFVMAQPQTTTWQSHSAFPPIVHQRVESQPVPYSPANQKKRSLARIVTPETLGEADAVDASPKKKPRKRRRKVDLGGKVRRQLYAASRPAEQRFAIKDFSFPLASSLSKVEGCVTSPKRERCLQNRNQQSHESAKKRARESQLQRFGTPLMATFSVIPPSRMMAGATKPHNVIDLTLRKDWNRQLKKRRGGQWMPRGHLTGKWKAPAWADLKNNAKAGIATNDSKKKSYPGCNRSLLPELQHLLTTFMAKMNVMCGSDEEPARLDSLHSLVCPRYLSPNFKLLRAAHSAVASLLPRGDCEEWEVVALARRYYNFWRPKTVQVVLLAESHAFTTKDRAMNGPGLDSSMLDAYTGPRDFLSLVYCLAYGENEALTGQVVDKANKGTPQFWTLLAACARGVEHVAETNSTKPVTFPFAADLLKVGKLSVEERLEAKLGVLEQLRRRGIWLLDASVFGWYIAQPPMYSRSSVSNEVHRKPKERPPKCLKTPSLVLSWELFTKHLIRDVAEEGNLKLLIPIGMEVEAALTRDRMEDAIRGKSTEARVSETFPAPNAWIPGGYGPFHSKLARLVDEAAPVKTD